MNLREYLISIIIILAIAAGAYSYLATQLTEQAKRTFQPTATARKSR